MEGPRNSFINNNSVVPKARSVLLHGNPQTAVQTVFFFPDGSGIAYSYINLPPISETIVSYGLNSPFLTCGDRMAKFSLDDVVEGYIAAIRCQQPHGPYCFAGWSAGGIFAFRAAQILSTVDEVVSAIALLDCPVPGGLGILPEHFLQLCESIRLFSARGPSPPWLLPHFRGSNYLLSKYTPRPLTDAPGLRKVSILWATDSQFTDEIYEPSPDDPPVLKFLTHKRTDFGAGGWADLLPNTPIITSRAEGENHFSLMKEAYAENVRAFLADAFAVSW